MERRSLISEMMELRKKDWEAEWNNPSWWNVLALWPIPFVLLFSIHSSMNDWTVAKRQLSIDATINTRDPPNHDRYGYTFKISGAQYTGWAYPGGQHEYSIGEHIVIHCDPLNPTRNTAEDFYSASVDDMFFVPFCVVVPVGLSLYIFFRRRAWKKKIATSIPAR
jgi:hypothetical protein